MAKKETRAERREKKKKTKMRVSGKSVFAIKNIIVCKARALNK